MLSNKELFIQKIKDLSNDRLIELLKLRTNENKEIMNLAEMEAERRGITISTIDTKEQVPDTRENDEGYLHLLYMLADLLHTSK